MSALSDPRTTPRRDYAQVLALAAAAPATPPATREQRMLQAVTLLWNAFAHKPLSWIGFYEKSPDADEMILICREPKPACSPIGLFGMCGRGWKERRPLLVADVRTLGPDYIACDPRDQSELVIPVINPDGSCWGVLDADSYDLNAFDEHDAASMSRMLELMGISAKISPDTARV